MELWEAMAAFIGLMIAVAVWVDAVAKSRQMWQPVKLTRKCQQDIRTGN